MKWKLPRNMKSGLLSIFVHNESPTKMDFQKAKKKCERT